MDKDQKEALLSMKREYEDIYSSIKVKIKYIEDDAKKILNVEGISDTA